MAEGDRPVHLFKPGQSGNPAGKPKGAVHGRSRALGELDRLLSDEENMAALGSALQEALRKKPLWFFVNIIMPLLPKETKGTLESGDRVIEWRGLVSVGCGSGGAPKAAEVSDVPFAQGTALPPVAPALPAPAGGGVPDLPFEAAPAPGPAPCAPPLSAPGSDGVPFPAALTLGGEVPPF